MSSYRTAARLYPGYFATCIYRHTIPFISVSCILLNQMPVLSSVWHDFYVIGW